MRSPLVHRVIYSFLTTTVGLSLIYYLIAVFPSPQLWVANATANSGMLVQALIMLIIYGLPAWAVVYLIFGLLGIPSVERQGNSHQVRPEESLR